MSIIMSDGNSPLETGALLFQEKHGSLFLKAPRGERILFKNLAKFLWLTTDLLPNRFNYPWGLGFQLTSKSGQLV